MTHSPQRNEVEDRGADTYLSICFLYLPYCRGVGFQKGLHRRASSLSIHTRSGGCGETGLRTRIERFIGFCYYRCNDFHCSTDTWLGAVPTPVSEAESSGVPRVAPRGWPLAVRHAPSRGHAAPHVS